jgi:hypothetical protein
MGCENRWSVHDKRKFDKADAEMKDMKDES